ncbi:MAG: ABC transporter ATP-binding protein [Pseudomonadota bacterium]
MLLTVRDVTKTFPGDPPLHVLRGVSLDLDAGESLALTGESGSGKSTLLHIIGGLETPDAGQITVGGTQIAGLADPQLAQLRRDTISVIFQQFNLIPSLTVEGNLAFHARLGGRFDRPWFDTLTQALGLTDLLPRYPEQLSGGQQQRVAIGRALAPKPKLVLADEPTGNLDEDTGDRVMDLMLRLTREAGAGLLMVTHSQARARTLDRQITLSHGELSGERA